MCNSVTVSCWLKPLSLPDSRLVELAQWSIKSPILWIKCALRCLVGYVPARWRVSAAHPSSITVVIRVHKDRRAVKVLESKVFDPPPRSHPAMEGRTPHIAELVLSAVLRSIARSLGNCCALLIPGLQ